MCDFSVPIYRETVTTYEIHSCVPAVAKWGREPVHLTFEAWFSEDELIVYDFGMRVTPADTSLLIGFVRDNFLDDAPTPAIRAGALAMLDAIEKFQQVKEYERMAAHIPHIEKWEKTRRFNEAIDPRYWTMDEQLRELRRKEESQHAMTTDAPFNPDLSRYPTPDEIRSRKIRGIDKPVVFFDFVTKQYLHVCYADRPYNPMLLQ